ncbi:glycosyltransferase family 2 protein [Actinospongicola halichondriae]|uniref:glycosyltransferase family 2 protein n=1 Tax=Actinospongicola halichondriae TaxID=3236844 RepID=UPI003D3D9FAA
MRGDVAGIVIVHERTDELDACLRRVHEDVGSLTVVQNLVDVDVDAPEGARTIANPAPLSYAKNVNMAVRATTEPYVALVNPDCIPDSGTIDRLVDFAASNDRVGLVAPQLRWPDGRRQPTGRSFPTVGGSVIRRTPLRKLFPPMKWQAAHYRLDEQATEPWRADWLLGAFWVFRREVFEACDGLDEQYPMYVEDIDMCVRVAQHGGECWVDPGAGAMHAYQAVVDERLLSQRNLWHARSMVRFLRRHRSLVFSNDHPLRVPAEPGR